MADQWSRKRSHMNEAIIFKTITCTLGTVYAFIVTHWLSVKFSYKNEHVFSAQCQEGKGGVAWHIILKRRKKVKGFDKKQ